MTAQPTDLPAGYRRTVLITGIRTPRPTTLASVFRAAARILARNGLHQGDHVPHVLRPMSIVAALRCAVTGDPHMPSLLADEAITVLALRLKVDGEGPTYGSIFDLEEHVDAWGDVKGRTTESAVAVLEAAGDACEVRS